MCPDRDRRFGLSREELEGFLQLLMSPEGELPEPTPEIVAYLEKVAARESITAVEAARLAQEACRALIADRLRATTVSPVRPFGVHLRAKRTAAKCDARLIASAVGEDVIAYELLEAGRTSPLRVASELLARIVQLFGLSLAELREAIRQSLERPQTTGGAAFARGTPGDFAHDEASIAADDLRRAGRPDESTLDEDTVRRLDKKMSEVHALLTSNED